MAPPRITHYYEIEQGTPEWNELRRGVITASKMSLLVTPTGKIANNEQSRNRLAELLAERITGVTESGFYSTDMERGHLLEPMARDLYSEHHSPVVECGFIKKDYGNFCIGYSPDGLVSTDGLIEVKSRLAKHHVTSILTQEVPSEYVIQVQTGLAVTGREWVDYVSFTPGLPLLRVREYRKKALIKAIETAAAQAEEQLSEMMDLYFSMAKTMPPTKPIMQSSFTDEDIIE